MSDTETLRSLSIPLGDGTIRVRGAHHIPKLKRFVQPFLNFSDCPGVKKTLEIQQKNSGYTLCSPPESETVFRAESSDDFVLLFDRVLIDLFLNHLPRPTYIIHACAFEHQGTLLVFPGSSGAGKTTLAQKFLNDTAWTFLSDELLAIDSSDFTVYSFPHPLNFSRSARVQMNDTLGVSDHLGTSFTYGLPSESRIADRTTNPDSYHFITIDRDSDFDYSLESISTGSGLQQLLGFVCKPNDPEKRFRRVRSLPSIDVGFHVLQYGNHPQFNPERLISDLGE